MLLLTLLWRNCMLLRHHYITTILEVVLPILAITSSLQIKAKTETKEAPEVKQGRSDDMLTLCEIVLTTISIVYCPSTGTAAALAEKLKQVTGSIGLNTSFLAMEDEEDLDLHFSGLSQNQTSNKLALVFSGTDQTNTKQYAYKIMAKAGKPPIFKVCLQLLVDLAIMSHAAPKAKDFSYDEWSKKTFSYALEQLPEPKHKLVAEEKDDMHFMFFMFIAIFYVLITTMFASAILSDKASGSTELVKILGMKRWMVWGSWLLKMAMVQSIVVAIVVIIMKLPIVRREQVFNSDGFLLYAFLLLYVSAITCFMFAITAFFHRALWGILATLGACIFTMNPTSYVSEDLPISSKCLAMLLPNVALYLGGQTVTHYEKLGVGVTWCKISSNGNKSLVSMADALVMLSVDILIYLLLAYYLEAVRGGVYGISEPWYYPINKVMQLRKNKVDVDRTASVATAGGRPENYEPPAKNDQPGISIDNLKKVYTRTNTVAVDGLTLDIYKGQITALLGHNGAGKTTTMDIITGMSAPTSGTVWVNGFDIRTDLVKVRRSLGLCTQKDIFFRNLTVEQNLIFVGLLKGNSWSSVKAEARDLLGRLDMKDKGDDLPNQLSGGQKRKLCMCVALMGGSQVVILDEPTSGMDPEARRVVWDLLLATRGSRTIIITTHYMEEADALGDKVAIMDHGKVVCYGTSLFLKNKFGGGFKMTIMVLPNSDVAKITRVVHSSVSNSELKSRDGAQLNYILPASKKGQFPDMFDALERRKEELGIVSMGVSDASLDDVFLAVGSQSGASKEATSARPISEEILHDRVTGLRLVLQQLVALLHKKFLFMIRRWLLTLITALLPILCMLLFFTISSLSPKYKPKLIRYAIGDASTSEPQLYVGAAKDAVSSDLAGRYRAAVAAQGGPEPRAATAEDLRATILADAYKSKSATEFVANNLAAAEMAPRRLSALYGQQDEARPLTVTLMNNALLRHVTNSSEYSIRTSEEDIVNAMMNPKSSLDVPMNFMMIGLLIFAGVLIWLPNAEQATCGKQIQTMTGASGILYWLSCFLLDLLLYMVVVIGLVVVLVCIDSGAQVYSHPEEIRAFVVILVVFGIAQLPLVYLFSCLFRSPLVTLIVYFFVQYLASVMLGIIILKFEFLRYVEYAIPYIGLQKCISTLVRVATLNYQCNSFTEEDLESMCSDPTAGHPCCPERRAHQDYLENEVIANWLRRMLICAAVFWALLVLMESRVLSLLPRLVPVSTKSEQEEDDVKAERERVQQVEKNGGKDMLVANGLAKVYYRLPCGKRVAVRCVTLGVFPGECFGLLGTNGAGKTTTFKMMTGGVGPTRGTARINQYRLGVRRHQYLKQIGYCPQQDAILEELSAREMLTLFARLRGIPWKNTEKHVDYWVQRVGLSEYQNKPCGTYSGGNKRKLSTAVALIGDPPVVFLDEPTSGIDPVARRAMWGILTAVQKGHNCIVLTSHSMDECEALCNRLSIQVNGELKCIGSIPYLKQKFGQGFSVVMRLKDTKGGQADVEKVRRAFTNTFSPCELRDEHAVLLQYHVSNPSYTWKFLFQSMESLKDHMSNIIEDYSLSETSLEEIFLAFAKASK